MFHAHPDLYHLDIDIPYYVNNDDVGAQFNKDTKVGWKDGYVYRHYMCIYTHCFNVEGMLISAFVNIIYVVQDKYILYLYVPIVVQTCINTSGSVK